MRQLLTKLFDGAAYLQNFGGVASGAQEKSPSC